LAEFAPIFRSTLEPQHRRNSSQLTRRGDASPMAALNVSRPEMGRCARATSSWGQRGTRKLSPFDLACSGACATRQAGARFVTR
jgi:hypothetical protein